MIYDIILAVKRFYMTKLSVIIPVYNVEKYLSDCLNSVVNQTLKDIEIICINDGSTDKSREILQEFADKDSRIKIIDQENKGQAAARNMGMKLAKGEFIGFVDSDDWIAADFYEKLYDSAIKFNADIAAGSIKRCFASGKSEDWIKYKRNIYTHRIKKKFDLCKIPKYHYIWNKIYNRKKLVFADITFEEGIYFEDLEFTHKSLYYLKNFVTVPEVCYYYRDNVNSTVNLKSDRHYNDLFYAIRKCQQFIKTHNMSVNYKYYNWLDKEIWKIFGITFLVIKKNEFQLKVLLFGFIEIFHKINYTRRL